MRYLLLLFLICGCTKDSLELELSECECYKYTKIAYDIYQIDRAECKGSFEGVDKDGYEFKVVCNYVKQI